MHCFKTSLYTNSPQYLTGAAPAAPHRAAGTAVRCTCNMAAPAAAQSAPSPQHLSAVALANGNPSEKRCNIVFSTHLNDFITYPVHTDHFIWSPEETHLVSLRGKKNESTDNMKSDKTWGATWEVACKAVACQQPLLLLQKSLSEVRHQQAPADTMPQHARWQAPGPWRRVSSFHLQ